MRLKREARPWMGCRVPEPIDPPVRGWQQWVRESRQSLWEPGHRLFLPGLSKGPAGASVPENSQTREDVDPHRTTEPMGRRICKGTHDIHWVPIRTSKARSANRRGPHPYSLEKKTAGMHPEARLGGRMAEARREAGAGQRGIRAQGCPSGCPFLQIASGVRSSAVRWQRRARAGQSALRAARPERLRHGRFSGCAEFVGLRGISPRTCRAGRLPDSPHRPPGADADWSLRRCAE